MNKEFLTFTYRGYKCKVHYYETDNEENNGYASFITDPKTDKEWVSSRLEMLQTCGEAIIDGEKMVHHFERRENNEPLECDHEFEELESYLSHTLWCKKCGTIREENIHDCKAIIQYNYPKQLGLEDKYSVVEKYKYNNE